ncbi:iron-containing alcohol dehydrogenase [Candidatus Bathyarchaeota archaeon]|nr:iron-containing alcohol dehydrogenase [Candidatus Bathyarchaeota archaeon]
MEPYSFNFPIWVEFGKGSSRKVGEIAEKMGWKKAFIVTDSGIRKAGLLDGIIEALESHKVLYYIYDKVQPNPTDIGVEDAAKLVKEEKCDFIVAVGGGSSMDTGKGAALLATNPGGIKDYEIRGMEDLAIGKIKNHLLPLITIPTTAGTGSEIDFWAVITDTERKFKMVLGQSPLYPGGPYLGAMFALVDPLLTVTLPPAQTASTGIDALSHAIETYVAKGSPPFVEPLALRAIELISKYLPVAYADGGNIEARENMMFAAHIAGICENLANCGIMHSLGEVVGGMYWKIPHGVAIAVFMPKVMEFNRISVPEKFKKIAIAMGENVRGLSLREASLKAIEAIKNLLEDLELPKNLRSLGVEEKSLPEIAKKAMETVELEGNPRKATYEDLLMIAKSCY